MKIGWWAEGAGRIFLLIGFNVFRTELVRAGRLIRMILGRDVAGTMAIEFNGALKLNRCPETELSLISDHGSQGGIWKNP